MNELEKQLVIYKESFVKKLNETENKEERNMLAGAIGFANILLYDIKEGKF